MGKFYTNKSPIYAAATYISILQLLHKSLNISADLLSQLCQSISLILMLCAFSTNTIILIASVQ